MLISLAYKGINSHIGNERDRTTSKQGNHPKNAKLTKQFRFQLTGVFLPTDCIVKLPFVSVTPLNPSPLLSVTLQCAGWAFGIVSASCVTAWAFDTMSSTIKDLHIKYVLVTTVPDKVTLLSMTEE